MRLLEHEYQQSLAPFINGNQDYEFAMSLQRLNILFRLFHSELALFFRWL
jgi:hypothetical protein